MSSHEDTATAAQPRHHRHSGGISLTAGSTTLRLTDFVIDPLRGQLTARVGDARVPILALGYATARVDPVRHVAAGSGRRLADRRGGLRAQRRIRAPGRNGPGSKVTVASELGTLAVLTRDGAIVGEKDLGALPVPAWLPDGDLLAATWLGNVVRLNQGLKPKWERRIVPTETDTRSKLLAQDTTPTVRKDGWGNADAAPRPLTPNLLADTQALIRPVYDPPGPGGTPAWPDTFDALTDGKPDAPTRPWLRWTDVGYVHSGWLEKLVLGVDTFRTQLRLTAITFVEDPAHPESWLRDLRLQSWDA